MKWVAGSLGPWVAGCRAVSERPVVWGLLVQYSPHGAPTVSQALGEAHSTHHLKWQALQIGPTCPLLPLFGSEMELFSKEERVSGAGTRWHGNTGSDVTVPAHHTGPGVIWPWDASRGRPERGKRVQIHRMLGWGVAAAGCAPLEVCPWMPTTTSPELLLDASVRPNAAVDPPPQLFLSLLFLISFLSLRRLVTSSLTQPVSLNWEANWRHPQGKGMLFSIAAASMLKSWIGLCPLNLLKSNNLYLRVDNCQYVHSGYFQSEETILQS